MTAPQCEAKPDAIDGKDLDGAEYMATRGKALGACGEKGVCVAWVNAPIGAFLDKAKAIELGTFLLEAAGYRWGPKEAGALLVAAREVAKARVALQCASYQTDEAFEASERMFAELDALAAVLKTIDGEGADERP